MARVLFAVPLVLALVAVAAAETGSAPTAHAPRVRLVPPLTDEVLFNPGMGLYLQYPPLTAKADDWFMQVSDIAYYRVDWAPLNPEPGVYKFVDYFGPMFDVWVKQHGKRVAFRVMCENMHSAAEYVTPQWVFDRGVPGVKHRALRGQVQTDPVFWDDRYLDVQCEFIRKLGEYLDGREGLEFVDIGSIGEWGEMHLARWSSQQREETGFTHTGWVRAYRRVIDAFAAAFPHTRVFLNVGGRGDLTINDYAALRGMHFRQDGLNPDGASYNVGDWLYKPYSRRGVMCNFEFHSGVEEMRQRGWDVGKTFEKGLEAPISYLNTNLGDYYKLTPEVRAMVVAAGRRVGYRFVVTEVATLPQFHVDGTHPARIAVSSTWRNAGVAPCYQSLATEWSLVDATGATVATSTVFPGVPTTQWWPGEEQSVAAVLRVPATLAVGRYRLQVAMVDPETGRPIRLGIAGRDARGRYDVCPIAAVAGPAAGGTVYEEGFEGAARPWTGVSGMSATLDRANAHSGEACLLVTGTNKQGWNYATTRVPAPAVPVGKYRLSAWMLVESMTPAQHAPYFKLAVNGAGGKWIDNYSSGPYDLKQMGTWQQLVAIAELPPEGESLDIAVEKGAFDKTITAALRVDDVKLELLEAS